MSAEPAAHANVREVLTIRKAEYVRVPEADRSLFVIPNTTASSNTTTNATTDMTDLDWVVRKRISKASRL